MMDKEQSTTTAPGTYKEITVGKTVYRVTSVFLGEKDLGKTLEQLAVRKAMTEIRAGTAGNVA